MSGSLTRRGVLTGAAALAGATALPGFLTAAGAPRATSAHVVVDERLVQVAAADAVTGPRVHRINALEDLCNHWYTRLRRDVQADAGPVAGLTTWMDYVVMRGCAAEIGYVERSLTVHPQLSALLAQLSVRESWAHVRTVTWVFAPRSL